MISMKAFVHCIIFGLTPFFILLPIPQSLWRFVYVVRGFNSFLMTPYHIPWSHLQLSLSYQHVALPVTAATSGWLLSFPLFFSFHLRPQPYQTDQNPPPFFFLPPLCIPILGTSIWTLSQLMPSLLCVCVCVWGCIMCVKLHFSVPFTPWRSLVPWQCFPYMHITLRCTCANTHRHTLHRAKCQVQWRGDDEPAPRHCPQHCRHYLHTETVFSKK